MKTYKQLQENQVQSLLQLEATAKGFGQYRQDPKYREQVKQRSRDERNLKQHLGRMGNRQPDPSYKGWEDSPVQRNLAAKERRDEYARARGEKTPFERIKGEGERLQQPEGPLEIKDRSNNFKGTIYDKELGRQEREKQLKDMRVKRFGDMRNKLRDAKSIEQSNKDAHNSKFSDYVDRQRMADQAQQMRHEPYRDRARKQADTDARWKDFDDSHKFLGRLRQNAASAVAPERIAQGVWDAPGKAVGLAGTGIRKGLNLVGDAARQSAQKRVGVYDAPSLSGRAGRTGGF